jgi:hypothetical protein
MSRAQAIVLALIAGVVAVAAGQVLADDDRPEPPAPIVVDAPDETGTDGDVPSPTQPESTTRPPGDDPAIVPTPTVGPTQPSPPAGDDDDDDGGGSDDDASGGGEDD